MSSGSSAARMLMALLLNDPDFPFGAGTILNPASLDQKDDYLRGLHHLLISLRRSRNASAPVFSLPPEILCRIFAFAKISCGWPRMNKSRIDRRTDAPQSSDDTRTNVDRSWLTVTHVCAWWRQIVLNDPTFWTEPSDIFSIPPRLVPIIIERSQSLPFRLDLRFRAILGVPPLLLNIETYASVFPRLQALRIQNFPVILYRRIEPHLQTAFLYLEYLNISLIEVGSHPVILSKEIGLSPCVKEIVLVGCLPLHWDCPLFSAHLTHLELHCPESTPRNLLPTATELANILSVTAMLEVLELEDIFPTFSSLSIFDYPPMVLSPSVRYLRVSAMEDAALHCECLRFLAHLVVPRGIRMDVYLCQPIDEGSLDDDHQRMISALSATAVRHIYGQQQPPTELIVGKQSLFTHDSTRILPECPLSTHTGGFYNVPGATSILSLNLELLVPLQHFHEGVLPVRIDGLRAISFMCPSPGDETGAVLEGEAWWHMLGDAKAVRRLGVYVEDCAALLPLSECILINGVPTFPILPDLTTIHIHVDHLLHRDRDALADKYAACEQGLNTLIVLAKSRNVNGSSQLKLYVDEALREWPIWDRIRVEAEIVVHFSSFPMPSAYANGASSEFSLDR